jgi:hypothetical protein
MPLLTWIKRHLPESILALVLAFLCFQNFTPGTYLIGWDNLMPELNIWLNLQRSLLAVWQEYQGLGLVGGMGHATDLIRQLIILPFTLILPTNLIRYLWHFAMLFLGTFGIYFGLKNQLKFSRWIAFFASLFYLLNFGSIQYFWVPFESFSTFWGFFPWLIFSLLDYLNHPKSKNLKKLIFINLLAIPSFYIQTIFIVYLICVSLIIFSWLFNQISERSHNAKSIGVSTANLVNNRIAKILLLIFLINAFWLLPFAYFLKDGIQNPRQAQGNLLATQETFERNQRRGYLGDFLLLRGYYYDFPDSNSVLMSPWVNHFSNQYLLIAGYLLAFFVIIGLLKIIFDKKNCFSIFIILLFFLTAIALLSATPPFAQINYLLRQFSLLDQVFRSPWTKFIVPAIFTFTILTASGLQTVINIFTQRLKYPSRNFSLLVFIFYSITLTLFSFPAFQGNYISPKMRQNIPKDYFQLFDYFKTQPATARIMNLPQGSLWGWTNYNWGTSGSGFLWYALPQPILDRAFDVWNLKNETYYSETLLALQQRNPFSLQSILDKYSIQFVIFDNRVYYPDENIYSKLALSTSGLLKQVPGLKLVTNFGKISLYQYSRPTALYTTNSLPSSANSKPHPTSLSGTPILPSSYNPATSFQNNIFHQTNSSPSHNLLAFNFSTVTYDRPYYLKIVSRHLSGHPATFSIFSDSLSYKFTVSQLPSLSDWTTTWVYLPQMENYSFNSGLTILFDNPVFNFFSSTNDIKSLEIYPLSASTLPENYTPPKNHSLNSQSAIFFYQTQINTSDQYLVLPQSFSPGWMAFYFENHQIKFLNNHILVNNWANGWQINNLFGQIVYLFFWPQLLEFIGFILLLGTFFYILHRRH